MLFKHLPLSRKISTKLILLTLTWWIIALLAIGFTLSFLWKSQGAGAAINDAGSLRMQTYKMALLSQDGTDIPRLKRETEAFSKILEGIIEGDRDRPLLLPKKAIIEAQANTILDQWNQTLAQQISEGKGFSIEMADQFVNEIDSLVVMIEKSNTATIRLLRFYQYSLIFLVVIGSITMLYILYNLIIKPLKRLNYALSLAEKGDFTYRETMDDRDDEFGVLSVGYNRMASKLEELYSGLEQTVEEKTNDLKQRNHELHSLYEITAYLHQNHNINEMCEGFIEQVANLFHADAGIIRILDSDRRKMDSIAEYNLDKFNVHRQKCEHFDSCYCGSFAKAKKREEELSIQQEMDEVDVICKTHGFERIKIVSINHDKKKLGIIILYFRAERFLTREENTLIEALGKQLGVAISEARLVAKLRQMAILEERNLVAQDLHDSIAQVLNFLNLQTQMMDKALTAHKLDEAQENLDFIKNGIKECYDNVRELLLNFRIPLKLESFPELIGEMVDRFTSQTGMKVALDFEGGGVALDPKEELEVIFILQEGLSNIRKHANASEVTLTIHNDRDFTLRLKDNGVGFDFSDDEIKQKKLSHVGMAIMHERAQKIEATLTINSIPNKGTELSLLIPFQNRKIL